MLCSNLTLMMIYQNFVWQLISLIITWMRDNWISAGCFNINVEYHCWYLAVLMSRLHDNQSWNIRNYSSLCRSHCIWSLIWAVCLEKCQHASVSCVEENLKIDWWTVADNTLYSQTDRPACSHTGPEQSHNTLTSWLTSCCKLLQAAAGYTPLLPPDPPGHWHPHPHHHGHGWDHMTAGDV